MEEVWKDVPGYEGFYQASSFGRVRSLPRMRQGKHGPARISGRLMTPWKDKGYWLVRARRDGHSTMVGIHRMVLGAFKGAAPNGSASHCNHINGVKDDNRIENLEWVTPAQNSAHAVAMGLVKKKGEQNQNAKLTAPKVLEIRAMLAAGVTQDRIAAKFGVTAPLISYINTGKLWTRV
jgi:hypothetical protein